MAELAVIPEKKTYTYEDYAKLPEGAPYQLIGGQLIMTPSPTTYHQKISKRLEFLLYEYAELKNRLGEVYDAPIDVYLEEEETYQPDIIFIAQERLHIIKKEKVEGAPDLVVEILSPSTAYYDLKHKKTIYGKHGVREYWIVDPVEKSIEVYENNKGELLLAAQAIKEGKVISQIVAGFEVELTTIF
ncbi:MAG: Uma2 family endonuclease [Candidatus Tectomicrobia bacterium]|uniref:Uma2 family endonuclease n=1 Tax=Tectimicrobiota bacterium TaxID=2528274 RepID=A0A933GNG6_UNCTE|nr:Uma2 family endonuclease [Candidatus Tectomicrobia bacterium]